MLAQVPCIGFLIDFPSKSALTSRDSLQSPNVTRATLYLSGWQYYLQKSYHQIQTIIADG